MSGLKDEVRPAGRVWPESAPGFGPSPPAAPVDQLAPGTRLNDMFEIVRLLGRGGMGAVYEGLNISSGERVAIKVLLPSLLHDQRSWELLRREANLLMRVSHPAIVQYRVLAQDAALGLPYMAIEYIDGVPLGQLIDEGPLAVEDVLVLLRRVAQGLERAHELGAVHRDLSPDNVILPGRRLDQAKVIDFGIAKDLTSGSTIIGQGFAGKLGYCAPEQLGDYDQNVGPWTDVYSLGLVAYGVCVGRHIDMGVTLSQAVDRRRRGVDIADAPERLRPLILAMLKPDPEERLRSMVEVLSAIDALGAGHGPSASREPRFDEDEGSRTIVSLPQRDLERSVQPAAITAPPLVAAPQRVAAPASRAATADVEHTGPNLKAVEGRGRGKRTLPIVAGCAVALLVFGGAAIFGLNATHRDARVAAAPSSAGPQLPIVAAIEDSLGRVDCALVRVKQIGEERGGPSIWLTGAAANPGAVASQVSAAARPRRIGDLRMDDVQPIASSLCPLLNALRPAQSSLLEASDVATSAQRSFEISTQPDGGLAAQAVVTLAPQRVGPTSSVYLLGPDPSVSFLGGVTPTGFQPNGAVKAETLADGRLRLTAPVSKIGGYGVAIVSGLRVGDDASAMIRQASAGGARAAATWFTIVDDQPNPPLPPAAPTVKSAAMPRSVQGHTKAKRPDVTTPPAPKADDLAGLY